MNAAGKIDLTWLKRARENEHDGQTVEMWLGNWMESPVRIEEGGRVYLDAEARYLEQQEIDEACEAVDNFA